MTCGRWFAAVGLVMLVAVSATAAWPPVSDEGLVLYFGFDGMTTADRGVKDGSSNHADGTIVRDVTMDFGMIGAAAKFGPRVARPADPPWVEPTPIKEIPDPYDPEPWPKPHLYNYIWMLPSDIGNVPTDGFTEAVWVKAENKYYQGSTDTDPYALWNACGYNGNTEQREDHREFFEHLEIRSDGYRTTLRTDAMLSIISETPMKDLSGRDIPSDENMGAWTHLAWTYDTHVWNEDLQLDQAVVKFYLNGVMQRTYTQNDDPATVLRNAPLVGNWDWGARLGCNIDNARQFQGLIDEFYLYDRPLNAAEILVLAGLTGPETPLPGDANLDRVVDDKDASILGANWLIAEEATWFMGDFNRDGAVNDKDAAILAANWGQPMPVPWAGAAVPEPSTVVLLLGALASLVIRRRRRGRLPTA